MQKHTLWFNTLSMNDVNQVGGKNASLGEMVSNLSNAGVSVPNGFATTSYAFNEFLEYEGLNNRIYDLLGTLDVNDVDALRETGATIRNWILDAPFPRELEESIRRDYLELIDGNQALSVAVRSSATAEDLPDASFAGQQETFLNVKGVDAVLEATKHVYASLFNDRAISYRVHQGFDHKGIALSAGIQRMVRSDKAASGVMFTLDTESGFDQVVFITSSWGLGEMVVQGAVNPDEFYVHKPMLEAGHAPIVRKNFGSKLIKMIYSDNQEIGKQVDIVDTSAEEQHQFSINDEEIKELAKQAMIIEKHYQRPMDIEWAKDGIDGKLYIVQARPETVCSQESQNVIERYELNNKADVLLEGRAIGQRIGSGKVRLVDSLDQMSLVQEGDVLVTDMTDPDWEPVMKRASAIITNRGGRTCHAAIIARELGIPAIVGCGNATEVLTDGTTITASCAEGETGYVYQGELNYEVRRSAVDELPILPTKVMMNVGNPERAFDFAQLPNEGVGLARLEFIINKMIGIHPKALLNFDAQSDELKAQIREKIKGYNDPIDFYVSKLTEGISTIAAAFWPKRVIVRMSDFKSNEYSNLIGGKEFEPHEENPMLGFRGASRYISPVFEDCFELETQAMKRVRNEMGLKNVEIMIPFVRTPSEAASVIELLAKNDLRRGDQGLKVIMMCELPSNAVLADDFLKYFDGFSIGSNDMTQLTLGLDRDSGDVAHLFDERNPAVKAMLKMAIDAATKAGKYVGICGQGPSDHDDLAKWLMEQGISSVSLNPDTVIDTWLKLGDVNKNH
ncbi:phosphoenolpyruvate synthase [Photobacterium angustum]|uniref:Phosphoenolpyruvate synthase n=1 Tax=Photobacterium angustum TaxID=661 RepID=A0A855SFK3_PHOAN|nr:phosphoenolpyruvate synthase [Photobacterium angustum]KJF83467.1 phosphoenolpyruvate synthase [Photobacterium damselae subsp. damselae]KJG17363.1 phosphoenolpyruvate synthase [Photobacterium angustum]KJG23831.1 phosphoenolpyruvate synthase [Photobacterium angustum]KJG31484.1 phosphoenolpyruvate synthase [Photobacterium angustum]KJG31523.1 phosphoenolpyruvate synthase [Photobacterium angustum]